MIYYPLSALINALASGIFGFIVLRKNPKAAINRSFFYTAFSITWWAFSYFLWQISDNAPEALFWCRALMMGAIYIPSTFFHFSVTLIGRFKKNFKFIVAGYCLSTLFLLSNFTPLLVRDVTPRFFLPFCPTAGVLYTPFLAFWGGTAVYAIFLLYREFRRQTGVKRSQIKYVFWGALFGFLGGATNYPFWYNIYIIPVGNIVVLMYPLMLGFAVVKYRLMDINIIIKKSLVYTTLITIITVMFIIFINVVEYFFKNILGYQSVIASVISAAVIALMFIPLKNSIQSFIERIFFKGGYIQIAEQNEMLRAEIIQSEKYKTLSTLTTGIVQEIRNPITALKGYNHFLPDRLEDKEFLMKFSEVLRKAINKIDKLTHQLADYGQSAPLAVEKINILEYLDEIINVLENILIEKNIDLIKQYQTDEGITLLIDPAQMRQALVNIIMNAMDAMPEGGHFWIMSALVEDRFKIIIKDSGCGIAHKDLHSVFDPFFSLKDQHSGLGLPITKRIIERHKGEIKVTSQEGKGTEVILELPIKN